MALIGLSGVKRSGKNAFADALTELGYDSIAYADKLREVTAAAFGFTSEQLHDLKEVPLSDPLKMTHGVVDKAIQAANIKVTSAQLKNMYAAADKLGPILCPRHALQYIATEIFRQCIEQEFWVNRLDVKSTDTVVTDCRFLNERQHIKDLGGVTVLIKRNAVAHSGDTHISETSLGTDEEYDYIVTNNSTLEELHLKARKLANILKRMKG